MDGSHQKGVEVISSLHKLNIYLACIFTAGSLVLIDTKVTIGIAIGSSIAIANFFAIDRLTRGALAGRSPKHVIAIKYFLKFTFLLASAYIALMLLDVHKVAVVIGLSIPFFSILLTALRMVAKYGKKTYSL